MEKILTEQVHGIYLDGGMNSNTEKSLIAERTTQTDKNSFRTFVTHAHVFKTKSIQKNIIPATFANSVYS